MLPRISKIECHDADYIVFCTEDLISLTLFQSGKWEDHILQISKFITSGVENSLVLDIGANLGAYAIPMAKYLQQSGGKVIGFEPQRIIYYQLCANIILNRLDNFHAIYSAIGNECGEIEIPEINYDNNRNIGGFSLDKIYRERLGLEHSMKKTNTKVPITKLDQLNLDTPPTLIKIDVEGMELNVIKGGSEFLAASNYPPILFEAWNLDWFKSEKDSLFEYLNNIGYSITSLGADDYLAQHPLNKILIEFIINNDGAVTLKKTIR